MASEGRASKDGVALLPYRDRPVGRPAEADLPSMTQEEREAYRETVGKLRDLVKKAEKGTKKAVPEIREILNEHPQLSWKLMDLSRLTEGQFIEKMTRDEDLASKETMKRQLACMREEVAGDNPSPLERLLAERVAATWLQVQVFEGVYASSMFKSMTIAQGDYHQRRIDKAHKRHLSAVRALAQIRKMGPAVQINIAEKQVNLAEAR